jgi:hypothetical protein
VVSGFLGVEEFEPVGFAAVVVDLPPLGEAGLSAGLAGAARAVGLGSTFATGFGAGLTEE